MATIAFHADDLEAHAPESLELQTLRLSEELLERCVTALLRPSGGGVKLSLDEIETIAFRKLRRAKEHIERQIEEHFADDSDSCPKCGASFEATGGKPLGVAPGSAAFVCQKCASEEHLYG